MRLMMMETGMMLKHSFHLEQYVFGFSGVCSFINKVPMKIEYCKQKL